MGTVEKGPIGKEDFTLWDGANETFTRTTDDDYDLTLHRVDWQGVDILKVYGGGVNRTLATITSAKTGVGTSNRMRFFLSPGTWTITDNVTITSNIELYIPSGALLSISSGKTLTINGPLTIGPYRAFTGSGSVAFAGVAGIGVKPQWWYSGTGYWTTAIQAAIDSVSTDGGEVILPPGDYEIDDTLTIENNGLMFRGIGGIGNSHVANTETNRGATIINKSGTADAIKIGKNETYVSDIILKDFALDGDSGTATSGNGIVLDSFGYGPSGVSSVKMYNISIHHVKEYALYLKGNIFECSFYGPEFRFNDYAIYADADSGAVTEINFFGAQIWKSTNYGFYKDTNVTNVNFFGCTFGLNGSGIRTTAGSVISGCRFEQNTDVGIYVAGAGTQILGVLVDNSTIGIDVSTAGSHSIISGAYFSGNTTDIKIPSSATDISLYGLYEADDTLTIDNSSRSTLMEYANYEILTSTGACRTHGITEFNSTAGVMAMTLANGTTLGQRKTFYFITDGGDVTLTVSQHETSNPEVFTFDDAGDYLVLEWAYGKWVTIKNSGVTL